MISPSARVILLLHLTLCLLAVNTSGAYRGCCRSYSKKKWPFSVITGLSIQTDTELCNLNAFIFHSKKGKGCFDPASNWVMDYVNRLRNKAQEVHMKTTHQ